MYLVPFSGHRNARLLLAFALSFTVVLTGCGGGSGDKTPKGTVSGKVTVGGQPFTAGAIHFTSVQTDTAAFGAEMKADGLFRVAEPIPIGEYKVSLSPPEVGPTVGPDGVVRPATDKDRKNNVPPKYATAASSDKTVKISKGTNNLTIDLVP